jgi:hypothetical protein
MSTVSENRSNAASKRTRNGDRGLTDNVSRFAAEMLADQGTDGTNSLKRGSTLFANDGNGGLSMIMSVTHSDVDDLADDD